MSIASALLVLGVGCGSRTSMLDADAYSSEGLGGFGNMAGSGNAKPDPNAVDPQRSAAACESYCKGFKVKCAAELSGRDCTATCAEEVNGKGKECQSLGIQALECLAPFFSSSNRSCQAAQSDGAAACSAELADFAPCAVPSGGPMPKPNPGRPGLVSGCDAAVSQMGDACIRFYSCVDGPYLVECVSQLDGTFSCSCSFPSGMTQGAIYGSVADPCLTAATDCRFY